MQAFPHQYTVTATGSAEGEVGLEGKGLPRLFSAPPTEFDGPGNRWSPETMVVAAVADCFVLTFRALARFARLPWACLTCAATGTLDRVDRVTQFTAFTVHASLDIPEGVSEEQATKLLVRADETCLIANSLKANCHLNASVRVIEQATVDPPNELRRCA